MNAVNTRSSRRSLAASIALAAMLDPTEAAWLNLHRLSQAAACCICASALLSSQHSQQLAAVSDVLCRWQIHITSADTAGLGAPKSAAGTIRCLILIVSISDLLQEHKQSLLQSRTVHMLCVLDRCQAHMLWLPVWHALWRSTCSSNLCSSIAT